MCPSKASRANDTATDPSTRASARYVCQPPAAAKSAATTIKPDANGYDATTTAAKPGSHSSTAGVCQEEVD